MKKICLAFVAVAALAGCKGDSSTGTTLTDPEQDFTAGTDQDQGRDSTPADKAFPWNRYFVTSFDMAQVKKIRQLPGFLANALTYNMKVPGHPVYGDPGKTVTSHPLRAARLDYALSTGLTGKGQTISIIDDAIRGSHEQFAGKNIYLSGKAPAGGHFHGTAVASVAVGSGQGGGTLGFAPAADLHYGYLGYEEAVSWRQLGQYMRDAIAVGAIVSNNSWGLEGETVAKTRPATRFSSADHQAYISGLAEFSKTGVIVFALQNDYAAKSASLMAAIPVDFPHLESSWISVVNAIPAYDDERILGADRISTACLETARFCMTANGQISVATEASDSSYRLGSGASFAAPQVSGSVALLAEAFPDLTASQLRDRLLATADNSFFDHTGHVTFAPGVSHGYDEEFGHGFLNLRDALLPIGETVIPTANGSSLPLGQTAITGGPVVGAALTEALASVNIISLDGLHGSFEAPATVLGSAPQAIDTAAVALATALQPSSSLSRDILNSAITSGGTEGVLQLGASGPSAIELVSGSALTSVATAEGFELLIAGTGPDDEATGFAVRKLVELGSASLSFGLANARVQGSVMGISVPGRERVIQSQMTSLDIGLATAIGESSLLRLDAEFGRASGNGAGMVTEFSDLAYAGFGVTLDRANVVRNGDVLSLAVRAPATITGGKATMSLPTAYSGGVAEFSPTDISLVPDARQIDFSVGYSVPIAPGRDVTLGAIYSRHSGHSVDGSEFVAVFGARIQL